MSVRVLYVRFGYPPISGKSSIRCGDDKTGEETGLSVYVGVEIDKQIQILLPSLTESACVSLSGCLKRDMYEVTGDVIGTGSDGEPLLVNVSVIKKIV